MNKEFKKRKKRFWALCLALVFALVQAVPMEVLAAGYTVSWMAETNTYSLGVDSVQPGDEIQYNYMAGSNNETEIVYLDSDGTVLSTESVANNNANMSHTVKSYSDVNGTQLDADSFKEWKAVEIKGSSGYPYKFTFQAVAYTQSNITYVLDGENNDAANVAVYYEGKPGVSLANASKENYTFDGWYTDADFSTGTGPYASVQTDWTGDITLYAKFTADTYTITYHNVDGATNTNPATYTYGTGLNGIADASKTGYTFDGWYSDVGLTTPITSISTTQSGNVDVYAKFTPNTYNITYDLVGGTNAAGNPGTYTYGTGVTSFADASKTGYTFDGWFSNSSFATQVLSIPGTQVGAVTLYAKFTFVKLKGEGSISVADVYYGKTPEAVVTSSTNGTSAMTLQYKQKNASDATYTSTRPTKVGEYTARAIFAETELYEKLIVTDDFAIQYLNAPQSPYNLDGTKGENGYYKSSVTIYPATGYLIADSLDGSYKEKLEITKSTNRFSTYLKKISTGEKTAGIAVPEIKIDTVSPDIKNASSGDTLYGDEVEIIIEDDNLRQVFVNSEPVEFENGKAVLKLSSNQGEENYEIIGVDDAGNKKTIHVVVAADWMKTKQIPAGEKVKLFSKYSYTLGSGTWTVSGDSTTYTGGTSFRVKSDGEYTFSNSN